MRGSAPSRTTDSLTTTALRRRSTNRLPTTEARTAQVFADEAAAPGPMSPPVDNAFPISGLSRGACSDSFGDPRSGGRTHMGVDCFAPLGTPLVAAEDGWIRYATLGGAYDCTTGAGDISGNRVSIRGRSGYVYYYGHLDTIAVAQDRPVVKGQVIGTVGSTGNACDTDHVHFEVKCGDDGDPFDPYPVMATWGQVTLPPQRWPSTEALGVGRRVLGATASGPPRARCGEIIRQQTLRHRWLRRRRGRRVPGSPAPIQTSRPGFWRLPGGLRAGQ